MEWACYRRNSGEILSVISGNMVLVSISDVIGAVQDFKRPLIEGEAVLESGLLVAVGRLGAAENGILKVWCLCIQTSSIFTNPHTINVTLNLKSALNRVKSLSCSCKAGTSEKCKHAIATLMHLNKLNSEDDLEDMSCTDLEQQWGKLKKAVQSDYEAVPITEFCHFPKYTNVYSRENVDATREQQSRFAQLIIQKAPKSSVFLHSKGARSTASAENCQDVDEAAEAAKISQCAKELTTKILERQVIPCLRRLIARAQAKARGLTKELYEYYVATVKRDKDRCIFIAQGTALQSEELWHSERCGRVTGSKIYELYTYTKNKKADWDKKFESVFNSKFTGNEYTVYGLQCEPVAREKYAAANDGLPVLQNGLFIRPELPFLGYSADGIIPDGNGDPSHLWEVKSLEVGKTTSSVDMFKVASCCNSKTETLKRKHKYYGQIQLGMLLMGFDRCDFMLHSSVVGDDSVAVEEVAFDEKFTVEMVSKIIDLYFDRILPWLFVHQYGNNNDPDVADV